MGISNEKQQFNGEGKIGSENLETVKIRESMKSKYMIQKVFSYLDQKKKLKIIIYNKKCQSALEINIEDYKNQSGKFFEGDRNGKGKEYSFNKTCNHNIVVFEGEYLNGKRNGKGKEYYENYLLFEGVISLVKN